MRDHCNTPFPVLTREQPPKRKHWESEHYRMSIFTAAGLLLSASLTAQQSSPLPTFLSPDARLRYGAHTTLAAGLIVAALIGGALYFRLRRPTPLTEKD